MTRTPHQSRCDEPRVPTLFDLQQASNNAEQCDSNFFKEMQKKPSMNRNVPWRQGIFSIARKAPSALQIIS